MAQYYVDNNKQIYVTRRSFSTQTSANQAMKNSLTIDDLTDLSGQSTVFVNWLRFEFQGTAETGGLGESYGHMICGIVPYSAKTTDFEWYGDFQTYKGWPLKNGVRFFHAYTGNVGNSGNRIRMVYTFRPKKVLVINRKQAIIWQVWNEYGQPITGLMSLVAQLKRGD